MSLYPHGTDLYLLPHCDKQDNLPHPQEVPVLIPGTCEYVVNFMWQRGIKVANKIKIANDLTLK